MACDGMLAGVGLPTPNPSTGRFDLVSRTSFLAHSLSRGTVHIRSADPNEPPEYDPRYLSHPLDVMMLGDITLHMQRVGKAAPLSDLFKGNGTVHGPTFPDELNSKSVLDYVRQLVNTGWHPIGTCAMLPRDKGGVVSPLLKVYGTANVRIIDASIAPLHVRGNTQSLVYAIAEYGADIVKENQAGKYKRDSIREYRNKEG
jgi:choline dehydrogenase